jgi:hypothetical protein
MITVKKLSKKTNVRDCSKLLWRWLEMTRNEVYGATGKFPLIGDMPFEVWQAKQCAHTAYGTSEHDAILNLPDSDGSNIA